MFMPFAKKKDEDETKSETLKRSNTNVSTK